MWLVLGLGSMGLLVGYLAGMTSSEIVKPVITLLFAFVGGSIFAVLSKLTGDDRTLAGKMLASLSILCAVGLSIGLFFKGHATLVSPDLRAACLSANPPPACLLQSGTISAADHIDEQKHANLIDAGTAYDQLRALLLQPEKEPAK